mmetsp:Transcript_74399/g.193327  ORF Transcript_74399/g.193327 Transcript_74399/m.193327 type:complete len:256 (+) Transcript_74399:392-1159(+)
MLPGAWRRSRWALPSTAPACASGAPPSTHPRAAARARSACSATSAGLPRSTAPAPRTRARTPRRKQLALLQLLLFPSALPCMVPASADHAPGCTRLRAARMASNVDIAIFVLRERSRRERRARPATRRRLPRSRKRWCWPPQVWRSCTMVGTGKPAPTPTPSVLPPACWTAARPRTAQPPVSSARRRARPRPPSPRPPRASPRSPRAPACTARASAGRVLGSTRRRAARMERSAGTATCAPRERSWPEGRPRSPR